MTNSGDGGERLVINARKLNLRAARAPLLATVLVLVGLVGVLGFNAIRGGQGYLAGFKGFNPVALAAGETPDVRAGAGSPVDAAVAP
jgi:hypothetical protein